MSKLLSLKLKEDVYLDVERVLKKVKIPRNTYINQALEFYNKFNERKIRKKQLHHESLLVRKSSLKVLSELEKLEDDLFE